MPIVVSGMKTAVIDVSSDESEPGRMWPRAVEMAAAPSIRIDGNSLTMDFNCQIGKEKKKKSPVSADKSTGIHFSDQSVRNAIC